MEDFTLNFKNLWENITGLKLMKTIPILALLLSSCSSVDLMVDKTQAKFEDDNTIIVPSSAAVPVVNADELNRQIKKIVIIATK